MLPIGRERWLQRIYRVHMPFIYCQRDTRWNSCSKDKNLVRGRGGSVGTSRLSFDISTQKVEGSIPGPDVLFRKIFLKRKFSCLMSPPPWHCTPASP